MIESLTMHLSSCTGKLKNRVRAFTGAFEHKVEVDTCSRDSDL